jgi:diguanylate cyclase
MNMELDENDAVIVRSTIDLGRNLGLMVVAEGVESETVWSDLAGLECDLAQGYYLSRPIPAQELTDWVRERADAPSRNSPAGQLPGAGAVDPPSAVARAADGSA